MLKFHQVLLYRQATGKKLTFYFWIVALPGTVDGVGKAADTLVLVAKDLANTEYDDFPDIQSEILGVCTKLFDGQ